MCVCACENFCMCACSSWQINKRCLAVMLRVLSAFPTAMEHLPGARLPYRAYSHLLALHALQRTLTYVCMYNVAFILLFRMSKSML